MVPNRWWKIAVSGVCLVVLAIVVVALVMLDKKHFGWMVDAYFPMMIGAGVMVGGVVVLVAALKLPQRWRWQGLTLIVWALIAATSPLFGFLFLLPWAVLVLVLPVVIAALVSLRRSAV